jgi:capsular exopolysaccharide synthesis family protein
MVVALVSIGFFVFSMFSYLNSPKYFLANARLLFRPDQNVIGQDRSNYLYDRAKTFNTHLEMLKSRIVLDRVAQNFNNTISGDSIRATFSIQQGMTDGEKTDIIELTYNNPDATRARDILNDLCRTYIEYHREVNSQEDTRMIMNLKTQIDKLQGDLGEKESDLRQFKETNKLIQLSSEADAVVSKLSGMAVELQQTQLDLLSKKEEINAIKSQIDKQAVDVIQSMTYENPYQSRISELELELSILSAEYGADHFKVKTIKQQIETLKQTMQKEISHDAVSKTLVKNPIREALIEQMVTLSVDISSLEARRIAQEQMTEKINSEMLGLPLIEQEHAALQREIESRVQTLSMLKQKYEEAKIKRDSKESDIKILELAELPTQPLSSKKFSSIFIGFLVGLILGIALAFLFEYLDQSLKHVSQVEKVLELPLLGLVPSIDIDVKGVKEDGKNKAANSMLEPFRALRANLKHLANVHNAKVLMICSAVKGEGKTTLSVNLSLTFSLDERKVILVDCDLRRSQIHHFLDVPKEIGVSDYLSGNKTITEVIKATKHKNLFVVTSGVRPHNPAEILGTHRLDLMIEELRGQADIIIFDSPALLPVSDSLIMAPKMDACVMVVRTLWTPIRAARYARGQLKRIGANMIGCIINGVPQAKGYYPYYYGYYGYYSYKYSYDDEPRRAMSIRQFGLAVETGIREAFENARSVIPRYFGLAGKYSLNITRKKTFWILLVLLLGIIGLRLYFENKNPKSDSDNQFIRFLGIQGTNSEPQKEPIAVIENKKTGSDALSDSTAETFNENDVATDSVPPFPAREMLEGWAEAVNTHDSAVYCLLYDNEAFQYTGGRYRDWIKETTAKWLPKTKSDRIIKIDSVGSRRESGSHYRTIAKITTTSGGRASRSVRTMIWRHKKGQWKIIREKEQVMQ